jgi:hypothetical protein
MFDWTVGKFSKPVADQILKIEARSQLDGLSPADEIARRRQERRGQGQALSVDHTSGRGAVRDHG